jgi:hypothetical protein
LANIDEVPDSIKDRVLADLNKKACFKKEFDKKKGYYNISVSFNLKIWNNTMKSIRFYCSKRRNIVF